MCPESTVFCAYGRVCRIKDCSSSGSVKCSPFCRNRPRCSGCTDSRSGQSAAGTTWQHIYKLSTQLTGETRCTFQKARTPRMHDQAVHELAREGASDQHFSRRCCSFAHCSLSRTLADLVPSLTFHCIKAQAASAQHVSDL